MLLHNMRARHYGQAGGVGGSWPGGGFPTVRRAMHFDGTSGGSTTNTLEPISILSKIEDHDVLVAHINKLTERVNLVGDRGDIGAERDKLVQWATDLAAVQAQLNEIKKLAEAQNRLLPGTQSLAGEGNPFASLKTLATRLQAPKGVSPLHFNLIASRGQELSYFGAFEGAGSDIRAIADKFGLNEVWRAKLRELHMLNDMLVLADAYMFGGGDTQYAHSGENRASRMKTLRLWADYNLLAEEFRKAALTALDTQTAGEGQEWVPTLMSAQLHELVQADLGVATLFSEIVMPSPTYISPVAGQDTIAYLVGENTEDTGQTAIPSRTFKTSKMTLNAKKLATRMVASSEILEDSIIAIAPRILSQMAKSIARAIEDAVINGDTTAPHMDNDVTAATDARKAWKGLRKYANAGPAGARSDAAGTNLTFKKLMDPRKTMKAFARPASCVWIAGFGTVIDMMYTKEDNGNQSIFVTADKYPSSPLNTTGEWGRVGGSPVIVSEFAREDLNASGVYDGITTDRGVLLYVNREGYVRGNRRSVTLKRSDQRYIEFDQEMFVATWRGDWQPWFDPATEAAVAIVYNI